MIDLLDDLLDFFGLVIGLGLITAGLYLWTCPL